MAKKRAMTPSQARTVKQSGHKNEHDFAKLIGGKIIQGTDKADVIDGRQMTHSVKAGAYWQIFLYGRERFINNTFFQQLGDVASIIVDCLDSYPANRADYIADKLSSKRRLQTHMRRLLDELSKPNIFSAFIDAALFDGGNADFLSLYLGPAKDLANKKTFHVFCRHEVVYALCDGLSIRNSKARNKTQMDDQKIIFHSIDHNSNMGEIEDRHDSDLHYKQMKCRFKASMIYDILRARIPNRTQFKRQVLTYGKATSFMKS